MPLRNRLDTWLWIKTVISWMAIVYIVCTAAYLILPTTTVELLWKPMFHVFGLQPVGLYIIVGFIEAIVYTALATWLFVLLYNYFAKSKR